MLDVVGSSACEIFYVGALTVEIRKDDDFFLVELAEIFRNDHVIMRVIVVQFHDVVVPSKIVGDLSLKGSAGEASPENFAAFDH